MDSLRLGRAPLLKLNERLVRRLHPIMQDCQDGRIQGYQEDAAQDGLAREVIGHHTLVCKPSDEIHTALQTMREGKIRRLPVVNAEGELEETEELRSPRLALEQMACSVELHGRSAA